MRNLGRDVLPVSYIFENTKLYEPEGPVFLLVNRALSSASKQQSFLFLFLSILVRRRGHLIDIICTVQSTSSV